MYIPLLHESTLSRFSCLSKRYRSVNQAAVQAGVTVVGLSIERTRQASRGSGFWWVWPLAGLTSRRSSPRSRLRLRLVGRARRPPGSCRSPIRVEQDAFRPLGAE